MRLEAWHAPPGDRIPNNPRFPVLIYRGVEAAAAGAEAARMLLGEHGWVGSWVDGGRSCPLSRCRLPECGN